MALVGWCMVHETIRQTRSRYELAEIARQETEIKKRLEKLRAHEESLLQPARLATFAKELKLDLTNIAIMPDENPKPVGTAAARRKPGEFYQPGGSAEVRMASAERR